MANKGRIDSIVILSEIEKEKQSLIKILDEIETRIGTIGSVKVAISGAGNFKELATAQQQYNAYIKDTDAVKKQLLATEKRLQESESQYAKLIAANKVELQKNNAELKAQAQYHDATTGSINRARAAIKLLTKERDDLNLFTAEGVQQQEELNRKIDKYNEFIRKSVSALEQRKINIGNYADSLAKPFETLAKKLDELKAKIASGTGTEEELKKTAQAITIIEGTLNKASSSNSTSVTLVKNLSNAYRDLSVTLGTSASSTTFLSTLGLEVGEAKDQVADLNDQLKLNASDTKGIDNVVGSLNALAGIAQGAAGAYALLGANQEDAAVITSKLIAVQGIANSIQQVGTELTRKGTIANKIYEISLKTMSTAFGVGSTAAQRFNAILKVGVVGIVITGLVLLISKMAELANKTDDVVDSIKDYGEGVKEATILTNKVKTAFEQAKAGVISKEAALKIYNETLGDSFGKTNNLNTAEQLYNEKASVYIQLMGLRAQANALFAKSADEASKAITATTEDQTSFFDKAKAGFLQLAGNSGGAAALSVIAQINGVTAAQKKAKENADNLYNEGIKKANEAEALANKFKIKTDKTVEKEAKPQKIKDDTASVILKEQFEQKKILLQQEIDADRKVFEDETNIFSDRLDALKTFTAGQMNLITLERDFEIDSEKIRLAGVLKALEDQKKEKGANRKAIGEQEQKEIELSNVKIETITLKGNQNLLKLGQDFNKDLKALKEGRDALRKEEEKDLEEYEEFTMGWLKEFRKRQRDENKKWDDSDEEEQENIRKKKKELTKQLYEEMFQTLSFFLTAGIDAEVESLETRQRLVDEQLAKRINQINMLGLSEKERIRQTAAAEKQAMFETEQLEKRKRKLAYERAKLEKILSITSIITSTAQAVVKVLKDYSYPANIAFAAIVGAIGALQLARAIATPLPQYRTGTDSAKKGLALVSEEGSELMKKNGQYYLTPATPTLMEMAGGEQITPAHLTRDILNSIMFTRSLQANGLTRLQPAGMRADQADTLISEIKDLKKETSRSRIILNVHQGVEFEAYINRNTR